MLYFDYPDPVIASYLQRASALGIGRNPQASLLEMMEGDNTFSIRVLRSVLRISQSASAWWLVRSTTRHVSDKAARVAYRALFTKLRRKGWDWSSIQPVALGLTSLRVRETSAASARRVYERAMGGRISAASIGWTIA
jgi:hypothetical protein